MKRAHARAEKLHAGHRAVWERRLKEISAIINRNEAKPKARLNEKPIALESVGFPNAEITAEIDVRIATPRGFEAVGVRARADFSKAWAKLQELSDAVTRDWERVLNDFPDGLQLPVQISAERVGVKLVSDFDGGVKDIVIPRDLALKYLVKTSKPWTAVVSHVKSTARHRYTIIKEHRIFLPPAISIRVRQDEIQIVERSEARFKSNVKSSIVASEICETLRGELRFVREGTDVQRSLKTFVKKGGK